MRARAAALLLLGLSGCAWLSQAARLESVRRANAASEDAALQRALRAVAPSRVLHCRVDLRPGQELRSRQGSAEVGAPALLDVELCDGSPAAVVVSGGESFDQRGLARFATADGGVVLGALEFGRGCLESQGAGLWALDAEGTLVRVVLQGSVTGEVEETVDHSECNHQCDPADPALVFLTFERKYREVREQFPVTRITRRCPR